MVIIDTNTHALYYKRRPLKRAAFFMHLESLLRERLLIEVICNSLQQFFWTSLRIQDQEAKTRVFGTISLAIATAAAVLR